MLAPLAQAASPTNPVVQFLPFIVLGGLFYLLLIRPQQRRAKAQRALINAVEVGEEIVTTSGIYGTVTAIDDEEGVVDVEIAPGVEIRMLRAGIGRLAVPDDGSYDDEEDEGDDGDEDGDGDENEEQPSVSDGSPDYPDQPGQIKEL
jgi:preprotein translocase subunit YajC